MRPSLIAGNWKMHKTVTEAVAFARDFVDRYHPRPGVDVLVAPPLTALHAVGQILKPTSIALGAQNVHAKPEGAFTGEVSVAMLKDVGCTYVIVGHSERRQYFGEDNHGINQKVHAALEQGLQPILCVGELLEEREAGRTEGVIEQQLVEGLKGASAENLAHLTIAYEPVWAIGTGKAATVEQAAHVHAHIRSTLAQQYTVAPDLVRILYGGSVNTDNAAALFASPDINGALVGKACLDPGSFATLADLASEARA